MSTHGASYNTDHDMDLSDHHFHLDHPFHWFLSSWVPVSQFLVHHSPLQVYYLLHLLQVLVPQFLLLFLFLLPCFHLLHPQSHCPKSRDKENQTAILGWPRNCCKTWVQKVHCTQWTVPGTHCNAKQSFTKALPLPLVTCCQVNINSSLQVTCSLTLQGTSTIATDVNTQHSAWPAVSTPVCFVVASCEM